MINLSGRPVGVPAHEQVLVTSHPLTDGSPASGTTLPPDTGVWLRTRPAGH